MLARELLIKFQMSERNPLVDLKAPMQSSEGQRDPYLQDILRLSSRRAFVLSNAVLSFEARFARTSG